MSAKKKIKFFLTICQYISPTLSLVQHFSSYFENDIVSLICQLSVLPEENCSFRFMTIEDDLEMSNENSVRDLTLTSR